ncbi:hypothetical protein D3C87_1229440 [compost metagenome]
MPIKSNAIKITICFAVGLVCGTVTKALLSSPERQVASPTRATKWMPSEHNKMLAPLKVEISKLEFIPETDETSVEIVGRLTLAQTLGSQVDYTWNLPEGVSLLEGQMSDSLQGMVKGQTAELKIVVTGFSKLQQRTISLSASSLAGDQRLGNSAILVSRPEDTFEAGAPDLNQQAEEQLGSSRRRGL